MNIAPIFWWKNNNKEAFEHCQQFTTIDGCILPLHDFPIHISIPMQNVPTVNPSRFTSAIVYLFNWMQYKNWEYFCVCSRFTKWQLHDIFQVWFSQPVPNVNRPLKFINLFLYQFTNTELPYVWMWFSMVDWVSFLTAMICPLCIYPFTQN